MNNSDNEMGPFGRSFIGDFPTPGTMILLLSTFFISALLSLGNLIPFLILFILSSSSVVYISYSFIEPHFNSTSVDGKNINFSYNNANSISKLSSAGRPEVMMSFQDSIKTCFKKWSTGNGRASRSEYNWFVLPLAIFSEIVIRIPITSGSNILLAFHFLLFSFMFVLLLVVFIPTIMVWIRRAHDIGFSGWYILLGLFVGIIFLALSPFLYYLFIIPFTLIFYLAPGQKFPNKYGQVPTNTFDINQVSSPFNEIWDFSGFNLSNFSQIHSTPQSNGFTGFLFSRKGAIIGEWNYESKAVTWLKLLTFYLGFFLFLELSNVLTFKLSLKIDISQIDLFYELSGIFVYFISFLLLLLILTIEDKFDYFRELIKLPSQQQPLIVLLLCVFVFLLDIFLTGFFGILTSLSALDDYFIDPNSDSNVIILLFYFINLVIAAPIVEELFFRGYLLDKLRTKHSDIFSIIVTGLFFGLVHWSPYYYFWHDLVDFSPILFTGIGGILYAWLRIKTGSIWPSIICHSIWNLFVGVIFML